MGGRRYLWTGMVCAVVSFLPVQVLFGEDGGGEEEMYFAMSLEELMNEEVRIGSLTLMTLRESPVSITTITREQIQLTPARNLADLIEIYVPGAVWLNHNSPRIGIRGIIIDRNYKLLLLINGRNVNNKSQLGATVEIMNWDLNDIERVEVIRGPGSVTYGPGAIAGIINIITKTGETAPGLGAGGAWNAMYRAGGGYVQYGRKTDEYDVFFHGSIWNIDGQEHPEYFALDLTGNGDHGFLGDDYRPGEDVIPFFKNYIDPQVKLHLDLGLGDTWRFYARYSSAGQAFPPENGVTVRTYDDERWPARFIDRRFLLLGVDHVWDVNQNLDIETTLSYDSEHTLFVDYRDGTRGYNEGISQYAGDPGNVKYNTGEHEIFLKSVARLDWSDKLDLAMGGSVSYEWLRPSFFWDTDTINGWVTAGVGNRLTADGRSVQVELGDGFDTLTYSVFGEANIEITPWLDVLVSGRVDKNEWSKWLFSPRVGFVSRINDENILKGSWQRAVRMNTLVELFIEDLNDVKSDPEELTSYELMYSWLPDENFHVNLAAFYNELEALGWDGEKTVTLGDVTIGGLEVELAYQSDNMNAGISHAFTKQLDFESGDPTSRQGISYSDYQVDAGGGILLQGEGDSLANFPEQATKFYCTYRGLPWELVFHTDAAIFWGYPGQEDMLEMYHEAHGGTDATMNQLESRLDAENFAETNILLNCSLGRTFNCRGAETTVSLFAANLLEFKRYQYVSGESRMYPRITSWTQEPRTFGVKVDVRF